MLPVLAVKCLWPLMAALSVLLAIQPAYAASVAYAYRTPLGVPVHLIVVDLSDPKVAVTVQLAGGRLGRAQSFAQFAQGLGATAAITGTYFDTRSLLPVGDIVVRGRHVFSGCVKTALTLTGDNRASFTRIEGSCRTWREFETVVGSGPRLLSAGRLTLAPRGEGFRDPAVFGRSARTAIGVTGRNKMLLMATRRPLGLVQLARVMKALGAVDAMALDGGSSTALFYNGRTILRPARRLTNLIAVYANPRFARYYPAPATKPSQVLIAVRRDDGAAVTASDRVAREDGQMMVQEQAALPARSKKEEIPL